MGRRHLHLVLAGAAVIAWACSESPNDANGDSSADAGDTDAGLRAEEVLASLADNVFAPAHAEFSSRADTLSTAASAYAAAVRAGDDPEPSRTALTMAYADAMLAWQRVEVLQLGPAAGATGVEGEFLRDEVYSWPAVNSCRIDQEIVLAEYERDDFVETRLVNVYGFDALEYLVFRDDGENTCPPQLPINADGEWAALGEPELAVRRAAYAAVVARDIARVADILEETWAEGGTWHGYLTDPSSGPLGSTQVALDEVLRAMFYVDKVLKDVKLARPAGIRDCSAASCPEDVESRWAALSKEQAVANLEGFQQLFWAGPSPEEGVGFDDLLDGLGEGALAVEMSGDAEAAIDALRAVEGSFAEALGRDESGLDAAHAAVVELTDDLKGDFPAVLMLNIPSEAAGDAD